jgi:hypothetical protein
MAKRDDKPEPKSTAKRARPDSRGRTPKRGAAAQLIADGEATGVATAREALRLSRLGLSRHEAAERMGVALSTYHAALVRGREEARSELVAEAVDAHLELVEGHRRQIGRLEDDAEQARGVGDLRAAAACEKAAQTAREALAKLWGANAPEKVQQVVDDPVAAALAQIAAVGGG